MPIYGTGECEVDLARRELRVLGSVAPIGGRAFEIMEILARSAGELVTKDELMNLVWPGSIVMDNTLAVHTASLRKALGPYRTLLKTESGRGYRLLGDWSVRRHDPTKPPIGPQLIQIDRDSPASNFPAASAELIGRAAAARRVQDLLSAYRVVTLAGPGGIGKTSLALKAARRALVDFSGGGWLVELASLSDPGLVPSAVAHTMGLKPGGESISAEIVARTIGSQHLLLVLDNCEHVIDAAADLVDVFVRVCPRVTVLVTSREALRINGEAVYRLPPLDVPAMGQDRPDYILGHSAVQLFLTRTEALDADFSRDTNVLPAIAGICRQLDGIPLAIEFAAARAATLGVEQVAAGLRDRFSMLTSGRRTAVARHRTLRATLDWSYELLTPTEQRLLRHLAISPAGFTLPAAASVVDAPPDAETLLADGISSLVSKSLVTLDPSSGGGRWLLLETVRVHALEKLIAHGESAAAARLHARFYRDLFASTDPDRNASGPGEDMQGFTREIDNVRAALDWSFSPDGDPELGVTLTAAYVPAWLHAALPAECRERTERAMSALTDAMTMGARLRMQLHFAFGLMPAYTMSPVAPAKAALTTALALAGQLNDPRSQFQILWGLWVLNSTGGACHAASGVTDQLERVAEEIGDLSAVLMVRRLRGFVLQQTGAHQKAHACFEHVVRHHVAAIDRRMTAWGQFDQRVLARAMLARSLWLRGFPDRALDQARLSLDEARGTNLPLSIGEALRVGLCDILLMTGDLAEAEHAIAMLIEIATSQNAPFWGISGRCLHGKLLVMRGEFTDGVAILRAELDLCERTGWPIWYPEFIAAFAEGLAGLGLIDEALAVVDKGLASADLGGERIWYPELLRLQGELLSRGTTASFAEDRLWAALELAHMQGALSLELRAGISLARLRVAQHRPDEAKAVLSPIFHRITEGFATADLRAARGILDALPS